MTNYDRATLENLLDGRLGAAEVHAIMSQFKDPDRFDQMIAIHQSRVAFDEPILLPLGEALFIVDAGAGARAVRCACGHEFGDYRSNWKLSALIHVRDDQAAIDEVYPRLMGCDPDWMELREYFCPSCLRQLEVEAVPPGYPVVFDFQPDLEAFYNDWLGRPLPQE